MFMIYDGGFLSITTFSILLFFAVASLIFNKTIVIDFSNRVIFKKLNVLNITLFEKIIYEINNNTTITVEKVIEPGDDIVPQPLAYYVYAADKNTKKNY